MVLSTQALLVAVGVGTQSAAPMAAALNWVMKDGVGQLGGVIFASQLGKGGMDIDYWRGKVGKWTGSLGGGEMSKSLMKKQQRGNFQRGTADSNPKRWRMVAALALDLSTLLEICTPLMGPEWFLPCASIANIGKNVGFLAASASRAAIHQSLSMGGSSSTFPIDAASSSSDESSSKSKSSSDKTSTQTTTATTQTTAARSSNLGDVTAKSGSQSIVASLLGTAIGIALSQTFCSDYGTAGILAGFVVLSAIHQVCTYKAVKAVPLRSLDRHRLHIVLTSYIADNYSGTVERYGRGSASNNGQNGEETRKVLSPAQVAERESFLPMMPPDDSVRWLNVGDSLMGICPAGVAELEELLLPKKTSHDERSSSNSSNDNDPGAFVDSEQYEKHILKIYPPAILTADGDHGMVHLTFLEGSTDDDLLRGMFHAYTAHALMKNKETNPNDGKQILTETHTIMNSQMPKFIEHLREVGWQIGTGFVNVECGSSHRLKIQYN